MKLIDELASPAGLCVLSAQGELAFYAADRTCQVDALLTDRLRRRTLDFLRTYLKQPNAEGWRSALLGSASEVRAWGRVSLYLEESTVRQLYPVSGRYNSNEPLTVFQRRNIEKGLHRGMELLLEYRHNDAMKSVVYCPVLFDRHSSWSQYPSAAGLGIPEARRGEAVIEVLNLAAGLTVGQREEAAIVSLWERLYRGLISKDRRHDSKYALMDEHDKPWGSGSDGGAYDDIDKRGARDLTLSAEDLARLHTQQYHDGVERWLEIPYREVDPERLRAFGHFRDLDDARLRLLATHALIYTAPPGVCLLERGMTDLWNLYLLEGSVTLEPEEGATLIVEGGSERGAAPVAFLKPRKYTVTAATRVSFLWIHDTLLRVARSGGQLPAARSTADENKDAQARLARLRATPDTGE